MCVCVCVCVCVFVCVCVKCSYLSDSQALEISRQCFVRCHFIVYDSGPLEYSLFKWPDTVQVYMYFCSIATYHNSQVSPSIYLLANNELMHMQHGQLSFCS